MALGDYSSATPLLEQLVEKEPRIDVLCDLVMAYREMGLSTNARGTIIRAADQIRRRDISYEHAALVYNLLGIGFYTQNSPENGIALCKRALITMHKFTGTYDDPRIAEIRLNIADVLCLQYKFDEALAHVTEALLIFQRHYPDGHPRIAKALNEICHILSLRGDFEGSVQIYNQSLDKLRLAHGNADIRVRNTLLKLGKSLPASGDNFGGIAAEEDASKMSELNDPIKATR